MFTVCKDTVIFAIISEYSVYSTHRHPYRPSTTSTEVRGETIIEYSGTRTHCALVALLVGGHGP